MSLDSPSRTLSAPTTLPKQSPTSASASTPAAGSPPLLARRDGTCGDGHHNCLDIKQPGACCDNQSYCFVDKSNEAGCCRIGSNCDDTSPCKSEFYYCTTTLGGITAGNSTTRGCCGRQCPQTSYYLCPPSLGGKCCPFDADCQADGNCVMKRTASSSPPTGTTTLVDSPTGASVIEFDGLSSGAKAGIGVGVALGTSLLIALLAWSLVLCRRRAAAHRDKFADAAGRAELTGTEVPASGPGGQAAGGGSQASDANATLVEMAENEASPPRPERPASPWESANVEAIDGLFELDGAASQVPVPEPPPPPPPEPNVCFPSHLEKV
ncbi:hypothetical protein J3459_006445 [Metarhizium acridum]|uniref:uncharacterized protein n=1 Tax=Metarhizium acridum TaxID=92637 RepID=UPI001C6BE429|nr:hypothetical protein J3458_005695 [Metarhizium acridum]KAG8427687.1 hypothetical protein J3459_006445 [Metarhizium acridum]